MPQRIEAFGHFWNADCPMSSSLRGHIILASVNHLPHSVGAKLNEVSKNDAFFCHGGPVFISKIRVFRKIVLVISGVQMLDIS
jgi:hypothetical protein